MVSAGGSDGQVASMDGCGLSNQLQKRDREGRRKWEEEREGRERERRPLTIPSF